MLDLRSLACLMLLTGLVTGCSNESKKATAESASRESTISVTSSSTSRNDVNSVIGNVVSTKKVNPDIAYKMSNKHVKFFHSLKYFGTEKGIYSDYQMEKGSIFGITQSITTTKGVYYHVIEYGTGGFNKGKGRADDLGYVKASDLKRFATVKSVRFYAKRKPYYVANPNSHRIWNSPAYTVHYAYVTHVFDRLVATQLYATEELVKYNGQHYVYLETAKGRRLGWVYKSKNTLISGKYKRISKQLLRLKKGEKLVIKKQSENATGNRVGVNDSLSLQQRAYLVKKRGNIVRVLVVGMDNRPTMINFSEGKPTKVTSYTYRRKAWKSTKNRKKLRKSFTAEHEYISVDSAKTYFYAVHSKKLVKVETDGYDGYAKVTVYRNGQVKFATLIEKNVITYPYSDFK